MLCSLVSVWWLERAEPCAFVFISGVHHSLIILEKKLFYFQSLYQCCFECFKLSLSVSSSDCIVPCINSLF
uniref:Uncharacterized protein n=1 Tax=Lepeophtheirus salmonis TaxID=72036 RepID=A0A0K2T3P1_LEPSM